MFIKEVETLAKEYTESILVDAELHQFRPSIVVAGLFSAAIESLTNLKIAEVKESDRTDLHAITELQLA